jgi:hypothetical protein
LATIPKDGPRCRLSACPPRLLDPVCQRNNHVLIQNGGLQFPEVKGRIAKSAPDKLRKLPSQQLSSFSRA